MTPDITRLIGFYKSPLGRITRQLLREQVRQMLGDVTGRRILALGFATPYLRTSLNVAERVVACMPTRQGASAWPREGPSSTFLADPLELPLPDASVDVVLMVHALEHTADAEEQMRELWRIAAPDADLIIVVPRRRGLWAQRDNTPFGSGNPYSRSQLDDLLRTHSFLPQDWRDALYLPPTNITPILKSARMFERGGRVFGAALAGVVCVRAKKQQFPAIARRKRAQRVVRMPVLNPQPARETPSPT